MFAEEEVTAVKIPFAAVLPAVQKMESVLCAESNEQAFERPDVLCPLANSAVLTPDCTSSFGDHLIPSSPVASPCSDSSCSKPVDDLHVKLTTAASLVDSYSSNAVVGISDMSGTLTSHSAGHQTGHASSGSDEVFVTSRSRNSFSAPLVEPLSSVGCSTLLRHNGQEMPLASNADGAFELRHMEAAGASEVSPLQQLQCNISPDISRPSSPSESESEPLGGCKDALLNPDHCISDLCIEDDDDSVFDAPGYQSPAATDNLGKCNNSLAADPILFGAGHSLALSIANDRIKRDCSSLLDMSKVNFSSFSNSHSLQSPMEFACTTSGYNETQMNGSVTIGSPFRSPRGSSVCDDTHVYNCSVPLDSSSPFRSPPKSSASIMWTKTAAVEDRQTTKMVQFESAKVIPSNNEACFADTDIVINAERVINCTRSPDVISSLQLPEISEPATDSTVLTTHYDAVQSGVTKRDETGVAGSDTLLECHNPSLVSCCDEYELDWTAESSAAVVDGNCAGKTSVNEVACNPSEIDVQCPVVEMRCESGSLLPSSPFLDVYSTDRKDRQASVKQLKCKFESEQELRSQMGVKSLTDTALTCIPNTAESSATYKLPRDATHSAAAYVKKMEDASTLQMSAITCADFANSSGVQCSYTTHNSECSGPLSVCKATRVSVRDFAQSRQPSVSARISCFEPVMSVSSTGCQKENKRARLSSFGSSMLNSVETNLNGTSHSIKDSFPPKSFQKDDSGWFVEPSQRSHAKRYQRCSSARHEDLLALLNIPATSAKHIPRVSERKRMFEMETAKLNSSESASLVACSSPAFESGPQRLSIMDKENSLHGYESNCQGHVNSRRSLFEGYSACTARSDTSVEVDCHSFKYPLNRILTKN